jgi:hypothetical protein
VEVHRAKPNDDQQNPDKVDFPLDVLPVRLEQDDHHGREDEEAEVAQLEKKDNQSMK